MSQIDRRGLEGFYWRSDPLIEFIYHNPIFGHVLFYCCCLKTKWTRPQNRREADVFFCPSCLFYVKLDATCQWGQEKWWDVVLVVSVGAIVVLLLAWLALTPMYSEHTLKGTFQVRLFLTLSSSRLGSNWITNDNFPLPRPKMSLKVSNDGKFGSLNLVKTTTWP